MRSSRRLIGLIATLVAPALLSAQSYPSAQDPRSHLKPGRFDAGEAASNMRLVSFSPKPAQFDTVRGLTFINSDLAFGGRVFVVDLSTKRVVRSIESVDLGAGAIYVR